ncbi:hypothetical protein TraAM80_02155 [Trypanosoma rangeli]|uniref:Uncharacterized protein n=1 Tax=Trypanosoma rangeli TaxID=5698 RepID=A0A422NVF9_TRYRA|nr:uncharacterized protein TraAM80_02155 [Trypanosoma rangeli]RNF09445.1 hypothetical protein TraAM80_02155 [Trypanosoma rangeli]|eukprot:RNF09445.1 hypothetical protein TraAM80_02155 [Trypanosoma rangeli]
MGAEEYFPITERSFDLLIRQYEIEAAAARADAVAGGEDATESGRELALMAQYIEDLASDARRLRRKLQACGGDAEATPNWSTEDVTSLRLLGFDVSGITVAAVEKGCVSAHSTPAEQHPKMPNLDKLLAMEKKINQLQTKVDDLTAVNDALRQMVAHQTCTGGQSQGEERGVSDAVVALTEGFKALKAAYMSKRDMYCMAQETQKKSTFTFRDICPKDHTVDNTDVEFPAYSTRGVADALCTLRTVSSCQCVRYCVAADASDMADAIDVAVVQLLNGLGFPFPVSIRRLGARGDYFIDRRVKIKLVGHQLVVRPWLASGAHQGLSADGTRRPGYEHLAKYLIHLYSPALDLDRVANGGGGDDEEEHTAEGACGNDIVTLKRQQRELQQALEKRCAQMHAYQKQLEAGLSPSSNAGPLRGDASDSSVEVLVGQGPRMVEETTSHPKSRPFTGTNERVAHILRLIEVHGRVPNFSRFSE